MSRAYCPGDLHLADGLTNFLAAKRTETVMVESGLAHHDDQGRRPKPTATTSFSSQAAAAAAASQHLSKANVSCCLGLVVALHNIATVMGRWEDPEDPSPLTVDSSLELYGDG